MYTSHNVGSNTFIIMYIPRLSQAPYKLGLNNIYLVTPSTNYQVL